MSRLTTVAALMLCTVLAGCGVVSPAIEQTEQSVAVLTTRVKAALIDAPDVDAASVSVTMTAPSVITLNGFVGSIAERDTALRVAQDAVPSLSIKDALTIR